MEGFKGKEGGGEEGAEGEGRGIIRKSIFLGGGGWGGGGE